MVNDRFPAYSGSAPYAFISYAHADSSRIYPIITQLYNEGFRIWYDEGIELTKSYAAEINIHLENCTIFVLFISDTSVTRPDVIDEFAYAKSMKKPMLFIHLDNIDISSADAAMRGEITTKQGIMWFNLAEEERQRKLRDILFSCVGDVPEVIVDVPSEPNTESKKFTLLQKAASHMSLGEYENAYSVYSEFAAQYPGEYMGDWGMVLSETRNFTNYSIGASSFEYIQKLCRKASQNAPDSEKEEISSAWNRYAEKVAKFRADEEKNIKRAIVGKKIAKVVSEVVFFVLFSVAFCYLALFLIIEGVQGETLSPLFYWLLAGVIISSILRYVFSSRFFALTPNIMCISAAAAIILSLLIKILLYADTINEKINTATFAVLAVPVLIAGAVITRLLKKGLPETEKKQNGKLPDNS